MNFKNFLKLISFSFLAAPTLALIGDCETIKNILAKDLDSLKYTNEDIPKYAKDPLEVCNVNQFGQVTEISLIVRQNRGSAIESALSFGTITKLNYKIDSGTHVEDYAYFNEVPEVIRLLPNLEEFGLYYYDVIESSETDYTFDFLNIDSSTLNFVSKKLRKLTLQMVDIDQKIVESLKKIESLEEIHIYTLIGDKNNYSELINIPGVNVAVYNCRDLPFEPKEL